MPVTPTTSHDVSFQTVNDQNQEVHGSRPTSSNGSRSVSPTRDERFWPLLDKKQVRSESSEPSENDRSPPHKVSSAMQQARLGQPATQVPSTRATPKETAAMICETIKNRRQDSINFWSMDTLGMSEEEMEDMLGKSYVEKSRDALKSDVIKEKWNKKPVSQYLNEKNYPSKEKDIRPSFDPSNNENLCAHGTNLSSVVSALIHTGQQMVPGIKARKLGVISGTGENGGTSMLNQRNVSVAAVYHSSEFDFDATKKYAENASRPVHNGGFLEHSGSPSDNIPTIVLGDGVERGKVVSGVKDERVYKRVNIRMIAVEDRHKEVSLEILKKLGINDIKICSYDDLEASKTGGFKDLWENGLSAKT